MSKPQANLAKLQQETLRSAWLRALRSSPHRKCSGMCKRDNGVYQLCAMALLAEIVYGPAWWQTHPYVSLEKVGAMVGLSSEQVDEIISRNDGIIDWENSCEWYHPHTYAEIADLIEGWF